MANLKTARGFFGQHGVANAWLKISKNIYFLIVICEAYRFDIN